jgi:hypothetical protein
MPGYGDPLLSLAQAGQHAARGQNQRGTSPDLQAIMSHDS